MNARDQVEKIKSFINDYFSKHNLGGVVLGISGGKDSAVVLALMVNALGKVNVVGVTMPCHSNEQDIGRPTTFGCRCQRFRGAL